MIRVTAPQAVLLTPAKVSISWHKTFSRENIAEQALIWVRREELGYRKKLRDKITVFSVFC